jgi:hypothetical protein
VLRLYRLALCSVLPLVTRSGVNHDGFLWSGFAGADIAFDRYLEARTAMIAEGRLLVYWTEASPRQIGLLMDAATGLGNALHLVALTGGFYLTFFYRWRTLSHPAE